MAGERSETMTREEFRERCYEESGTYYSIPENELDEVAGETGCADEDGRYDADKISVRFNCKILPDMNPNAAFPGCMVKF